MRTLPRATGVVACALFAAVTPVHAQLSGPTQKLRVAVMDLSGSALRMQSTTMGVAGQPMQPGTYPNPNQTTVTIAIPPPPGPPCDPTQNAATVNSHATTTMPASELAGVR